MLFAIVFAIIGYRRARRVGKNGFLWAFYTMGAFLVVQLFLVSILRFSILALIISLIAGFLVLNSIDENLQKEILDEPPPPSKLDENQ